MGAGRDAFIMSWVRDFSSPMERQFRRRQGVKRHLESQFCGYARGVVVTEGVSAGEGVIVGQLNGARLDRELQADLRQRILSSGPMREKRKTKIENQNLKTNPARNHYYRYHHRHHHLLLYSMPSRILYSILYTLLYTQKKKDVGLSLEYIVMVNMLILVE